MNEILQLGYRTQQRYIIFYLHCKRIVAMVILSDLDRSVIIIFFVISLFIGLKYARQSGKDAASFFLSGRNMPWWLLGISMVATTFSADTPNLVTDIVRKNGISGNWVWWSFLLTGMLTVYVYSKLWRRTGFVTDLEFYELRYSGRAAAFLRVFRAFYLGVIFNVLVMATVCLAGIKIGSVLLGLTPYQTIILASIVTVLYASFGGLRGIIMTDLFQFVLAMIGTIWAAWFIVNLPQIGGLEALLTHSNVQSKLSFVPEWGSAEMITLFIIPLTVQWWASYYPGAEPGGGGYIAQRMLSAKDESNALTATLLFNIVHYALRPWPWILIALASLIVFPDLDSIKTAFPHVDSGIVNDDLAYPAMLTFLPAGLLGVVVASLIAAFMSTISTHLNWGASYVTNDIYKRVINPNASGKTLVNVGRAVTVVTMFLAAIISLYLENAEQAFQIIVLLGAGTGLIFILRWFWWRISAYSEIAAMLASFVIALYLAKSANAADLETHVKLLLNVGLTTAIWLAVTFLTPATDHQTLTNFYNKIRPAGWHQFQSFAIMSDHNNQKLGAEILAVVTSVFLVYAILFAIGYLLFGEYMEVGVASLIVTAAILIMRSLWAKVTV